MPQTWKQKLETAKEAKVTTLRKAMGGVPAGGRLLMPTPRQVQSLVNDIPRGQTLAVDGLRARLAERFAADLACPLTTSAALRTVAEAAWEDVASGAAPSAVTPFWRVVEPGSALARKLSFNPEFIAEMRRQEAG